jgi:predicted ATPase
MASCKKPGWWNASEVAQLAALLDRARGGDGGVAVVQGPAGIGKTALPAALAAPRRQVQA